MKKLILILSCYLLGGQLFAQSIATSSGHSFDIRKKKETPYLEFVSPPTFVDTDGNKAINANENCSIFFKIRNTGRGDASRLKATLKATGGNTMGLVFKPYELIPKVGKGEIISFNFPISGNANTVDGKVYFDLEIEEPNGFGIEKVTMQVGTQRYLKAEVKVVDHIIYAGDASNKSLELKKPFTLQLLVQNLGQGVAKNVKAEIIIPENVMITDGDFFTVFETLNPGEKKSIEYEMVINSKYKELNVPIRLAITEAGSLMIQNWNENFKLNQTLSQQKIIIESNIPMAQPAIVAASLHSDVDKDIPLGLSKNAKKYALIIGCEDYSKYQTGLDKEVNVDYAANDAQVFSEYAEKTLGYPRDQIYTLTNATASQIKQNIEKLVKAIEIENGEAEILFYYSGHGLPDEETKEPYLIPVDVNGNNPQDGISLIDLYTKLSASPTKKATVILDACFSGGARNKALVALKGVKVKPRMDAVMGNLVVFASSNGSESSAVYNEKQHGYFTYFLLKDLKESAGSKTLNDSFSDISYNVKKEVLKIGKTQSPEVLPGLEIGEGWKDLKW